MNDIHFHLLINHFPIVGAIFASLVLLIGIVVRAETVKRTAYGLFLLTALLSIPTNQSGENAEGKVEKLEGVNDIHIEKHEELAEIAFWAILVTGAISLLAFYFSIKEHPIKGIFAVLVLAVACVSLFYLWKTGESGGKIRHPEAYDSAS